MQVNAGSGPKRFVVIGNPVAHSLSPQIHQAFARQIGIELNYERLQAPLDQFEAMTRAFFAGGGAGMNVTLPFKVQAHDLADHLDETAAAAGSVNTLSRDEDGIHGFNTDGVGLLRDLVMHQGLSVADRRVLVLGAGGAVQGILPALLAAGPASVDIHNRTVSKARALCERNSGPLSVLMSADLQRLAEQRSDHYDLIVNGTSASLLNEAPDLPPAILRGALCYDLVYGRDTVFLSIAKKAGARRCVDGLGMLVEQAAEAFRIWHDKMPETRMLLVSLRTQLQSPIPPPLPEENNA